MKKYIKNIIIFVAIFAFVSFILFMLFFKKYNILSINNKGNNINNLKVNNNLIINKNISEFKINFLNCRNSVFKDSGKNITYSVFYDVGNISKCNISIVKIDKDISNTISCTIDKKLINSNYVDSFINDFDDVNIKNNITKYKECYFNSSVLPEINKTVDDFKNNFVKCNKSLFFDANKSINYNVFEDVMNKDKCILAFNIVKNNKTIICNIRKNDLSLKLYDSIVNSIENNNMSNLKNIVCN